jgi:hypothetical protein
LPHIPVALEAERNRRVVAEEEGDHSATFVENA